MEGLSKVFKVLPTNEELTADVLLKAILTTGPDTRTRQRFCMVLGRLAKFARLEFDPKPYQGSYSPKKVVPRNLPTDDEDYDVVG